MNNLGLRSTIGDASLCCCHVVASVRNGNTVAVHATLQFGAFDRPATQQGAQEIGRTIYFLENLRAGETRAVDAPGFVFPCNQVGDLRYEVKVRGLLEPEP